MVEGWPGFADLEGRVWVNTAHQGALPDVAAEATRTAIDWKQRPFALTQDRFDGVPQKLRAALGRLVNVAADEIILANSASYGLHLVANAYPWQAGDEVLVMAGDFPSDILAWTLLEKRHGVVVRRIRPQGVVVEADELAAAITPRTRLFCTTWVHSFSGYAIDVDALGSVCRAHGVVFMANASQAAGARQVDLARAPVDALTSVGHKWLCGPYGSGFCWIHPALRARLAPTKAYWLAMLTAADLEGDLDDVALPDGVPAHGYDVFATANFFNFMALTAAVELLLDIGIEAVRDHDQALVTRLLDGIDRARFDVLSPERGERRSTLVFLSHTEPDRNAEIVRQAGAQGVFATCRNGRIRVSPHLYNSDADIDRTLTALNGAGV